MNRLSLITAPSGAVVFGILAFMKQVVVIGGGDTFKSYEDYLSGLRNKKIESLDYFKGLPDWKQTLQLHLGEDYEVIAPRMPNKQNAKYIEWQVWFEKLVPFLKSSAILIGHSLGGSFLARYLAENRLPIRLSGVSLVAAPHDADDDLTEEFAAPASLSLLSEQCDNIFLYYSEDDPVVSFVELAKYQSALPQAVTRTFIDRGHFNQETFPELVGDIRGI